MTLVVIIQSVARRWTAKVATRTGSTVLALIKNTNDFIVTFSELTGLSLSMQVNLFL